MKRRTHAASTRQRLALFCAASVFCALAAPSHAADTRWRNPDGGTFSIGGNWNNGVPGVGDVAQFGLSTPGIFGALPPYTVSFTANATNNALVVEDDRVMFDLNGHVYTAVGRPFSSYHADRDRRRQNRRALDFRRACLH